VNYARDTKKKLDQDLKIKLELDVANFQIQLDQARARLREAKKQGDKDAIINAQLETNQLQRGLTEAKRQLNNYVNTGDKDLSRLQMKFD
jgi:topoisomerase IA-like protein